MASRSIVRAALTGIAALLIMTLMWNYYKEDSSHYYGLARFPENIEEDSMSQSRNTHTVVNDSSVLPARPQSRNTHTVVNDSSVLPARPLSINLVVVPFFAYKAPMSTILRRQEEYRTTLERNLNHKMISRVHILTTDPEDILKRFKDLANHSKLVVVKVKSIDQMRDPWDYISENLVGQDVMFANADIYLGGGFELVDPLVMVQQKIMYCLTRQVTPEEKCGEIDKCRERDYMGSHDVFLVHLTEPLPEEALKEMEFLLASSGMESVVQWIFQKILHYCTLNPCSILEIFHLHCTHLRNSEGKFRVNNAVKNAGSPFTNSLVYSSA